MNVELLRALAQWAVIHPDHFDMEAVVFRASDGCACLAGLYHIWRGYKDLDAAFTIPSQGVRASIEGTDRLLKAEKGLGLPNCRLFDHTLWPEPLSANYRSGKLTIIDIVEDYIDRDGWGPE